MIKPIRIALAVLLLCSLPGYAQIQELKNWLAQPVSSRTPLTNLKFAKQSLTKIQAQKATSLLLADRQAILLSQYDAQWNNRLIVINDLEVRFYYQTFGARPSSGRSLFISLHGGGGAPASVNDQQYENQKHLYDNTLTKMEGVYLALRAPTNTWDLWHQDHVDDFLNIVIQLAIIKENVNPNKVYILGYSAGGDGLYQLAPRMADRWAAASMMAGHPGDASPVGLRNIPFAVHVGALDDAYNRNGMAKQWKNALDSLKRNDPEAYIHDVQLHEGFGHWLKRRDSVALLWMNNYVRNPIPQKVIWKQDNRHHTSFYWLGVPKNLIVDYGVISVAYNPALNEINIIDNYSSTIKIFSNDKMLNLDKPLTIKYRDAVIHQGVISRTILTIHETLTDKGDPNLSFPAAIKIVNNKVVE
jgi:poly(3-hydroxybutyrate) depolymerase